MLKLKVQFCTQRKRFDECAQNLTFHVGGAKTSLWLCLYRKFVLQNVGGSEWVWSQKRLIAWRRKDWHRLHGSSYCYFKVYAGTHNLNPIYPKNDYHWSVTSIPCFGTCVENSHTCSIICIRNVSSFPMQSERSSSLIILVSQVRAMMRYLSPRAPKCPQLKSLLLLS